MRLNFVPSGPAVPVLKQVWEVSVRGKPVMGRQEFRTAMRLISIAQAAAKIPRSGDSGNSSCARKDRR